MNPLFALQSTAGQRTHEALFEAVFIWHGLEFPCVHGDITTNPALIMGGYSPDTEVLVTVRMELFPFDENGHQLLPAKDQPCFLRPAGGGGVIALKVATVETSVGDAIQNIHCVSVDQGA